MFSYFENQKTIMFYVSTSVYKQKSKLYFQFRISIYQKKQNGTLGSKKKNFLHFQNYTLQNVLVQTGFFEHTKRPIQICESFRKLYLTVLVQNL